MEHLLSRGHIKVGYSQTLFRVGRAARATSKPRQLSLSGHYGVVVSSSHVEQRGEEEEGRVGRGLGIRLSEPNYLFTIGA